MSNVSDDDGFEPVKSKNTKGNKYKNEKEEAFRQRVEETARVQIIQAEMTANEAVKLRVQETARVEAKASDSAVCLPSVKNNLCNQWEKDGKCMTVGCGYAHNQLTLFTPFQFGTYSTYLRSYKLGQLLPK